MIGAHPDDENTALLAWLALGRNVRTAYLSLTRGEGGQNLIGSEQGVLLGMIRTEELLAARQIDGAEQFFTEAVDFGYSKTAEEALTHWDSERTLGQIVQVIRTFRPNVIILCFSGTPRDGHGQHQASAILAKRAYEAAADPARFPEQLTSLKPWRAKRVVWSVYGPPPKDPGISILNVDLGDYSPLLGYSFTEIAGMSRSMHRSQSMGWAQDRGSRMWPLVHVAGDAAHHDLFDGLPGHWENPELAGMLREVAREFNPRQPSAVVPALLEARGLLPPERRGDIDRAVALALGLWLDAASDRPTAVPGADVKVTLRALNRSTLSVRLRSAGLAGSPVVVDRQLDYNKTFEANATWTAVGRNGSAPEIRPRPEPVLKATFELEVSGAVLTFEQPVQYRYVDDLYGERVRPLAVVPPVAVSFPTSSVILPTPAPRRVPVRVEASAATASGRLELKVPGWTVEPPVQTLHPLRAGELRTYDFTVHPPQQPDVRVGGVTVRFDGQVWQQEVITVNYPHITPRTVIPPARVNLVRADIRTLATNVGYVTGAGDEIPAALRQIGCRVTLLGPAEITDGDLRQYHAIVTGVRAFNTRPDLPAAMGRLLDYVRSGGTLVVQYNVLERGQTMDNLGPYPIKLGRARVSVEEAPVDILRPDHVLFNHPNRITPADFTGWVQERGLYFPEKWDEQYAAVIASHDPGEKPLPGGLLFARLGKGAYIYTSYSWFRQLPAGVPGAYRVFANLISAGQALNGRDQAQQQRDTPR
jgi:LmbE family N-acetylglucosaminyl deacetylase